MNSQNNIIDNQQKKRLSIDSPIDLNTDSEKPRKKRPATQKRLEQNRTAQKAFRQRKGEHLKELQENIVTLKSQLANANLLINEYQMNQFALDAAKNENLTLLHERQQMIHIMDKLRSVNTILMAENQRLNKHKPTVPTSNIPKQPNLPDFKSFVKGGNFGSIMRPPLSVNPIETTRRPSQYWTSLTNTFVDKSSTTGGDKTNDERLHSATDNTSELMESTSSETQNSKSSSIKWEDMNKYPGFPNWTPPNSTTLETNTQPSPYHISFSYSDAVNSHFTLPQFTSSQFSSDNISQINSFPMSINTMGSWELPKSTTPQLQQNLDLFGMGTGNMMPFLPSTNLMVPLLHHIPFTPNTNVPDFMSQPLPPSYLDSVFVPKKD
ncbi:hypothetical protein BC833DRAFT_624941 [Globomyces pollinis-pini]|nr:hypothetical protein BC833DRAFT_624941 [Globomyces pollinis-pini]